MTTPRTNTPATSASSGLEALMQQAQSGQRTGPSGDGAAFQRWMQQYRQPQAAEAASPTQSAAPASVRAAVPVSTSRAQAAREGRERDAELQPARPEHADDVHTATSQASASTQPGKPGSKDVRKAAAARPHEAAKPNRPEGQNRADTEAAAQPEDAGDAVRFQTAQGEATAWVKELPVPDDVAVSDPAAMLAWLSSLHSLVQPDVVADEHAQALGMEAGKPAIQMDHDGRQQARYVGADALTLPALQRGPSDGAMGQEQGEDAATGDGQGALSLSARSLTDTTPTGNDTSSISFASALQREMQPAVGARAEGAGRHYTGNLHTPMDSPAFTQALTDRVAFWVNGPAAEGQMTAELRLNPAEMGPVHIRIELDGQNAQIDFAAAAAETRQAIEASLGQLSAALEESGLKLSGGGVSDQTPQQQAWAEAAGQPGQGQGGSARQGRQPEGRWASAAVADGASESLGSRPPRPGRVGGLDLYA